jgi:hypothetical protein
MAGVAGRSGRTVGAHNKKTAELSERICKILGAHPVDKMAMLAVEAHQNGEYTLAGKMLQEVSKYVAPQLKAVEHSGTMGVDAQITNITRMIVDVKPGDTDSTGV